CRNKLYDWKIFKSYNPENAVVCVGNLSVGGTGKTPHIEYCVRLCEQVDGLAILSRGYKRKTKGFRLAGNQSTADSIGDEPFQYYNKFKNISVAVDEKRARGIKKLNKKRDPKLILLDDAFQHRKVKANLNILITDYSNLFTKDLLMPAGRLRENRFGAKRAELIIVSKCPEQLSDEEKEKIKKKIKFYSQAQVLFSKVKYSSVEQLFSDESDWKSNKYEHLVAITGIAKSKAFVKNLNSKAEYVRHYDFPDHHRFKSKEIKKIVKQFHLIPSENKAIITTEKDAMRLMQFKNELNGVDVFYQPIEVEMNADDKAFLKTRLLETLTKNQKS
ncbi:MAG: tetraacyldisaccharide 4'-kinase, partial [Flavobacteriales bacterium]